MKVGLCIMHAIPFNGYVLDTIINRILACLNIKAQELYYLCA